MNTIDSPKLRWVGIAEVSPLPGNLELQGAAGAYVAVVGLAISESDFHSRVNRAIQALGFELEALEEVRLITSEMDLRELDATLRARVQALRDENPVEVGSFHIFSE